jgi:hypothetical protein
MGFVGKLCRRHDELACDGFGATGGWGFDCGALSPTADGLPKKNPGCLRIGEYLQHELFRSS